MDYVGMGRTNYFRVKDEEKFLEVADRMGARVLRDRSDPSLFALVSEEDNGSLGYCAEEDGDSVNIDTVDAIAPLLADGSVCVFVHIGYEGNRYLRYLIGTAIAFNGSGKFVCASMEDVYQKAEEAFGAAPSRAEY